MAYAAMNRMNGYLDEENPNYFSSTNKLKQDRREALKELNPNTISSPSSSSGHASTSKFPPKATNSYLSKDSYSSTSRTTSKSLESTLSDKATIKLLKVIISKQQRDIQNLQKHVCFLKILNHKKAHHLSILEKEKIMATPKKRRLDGQISPAHTESNHTKEDKENHCLTPPQHHSRTPLSSAPNTAPRTTDSEHRKKLHVINPHNLQPNSKHLDSRSLADRLEEVEHKMEKTRVSDGQRSNTGSPMSSKSNHSFKTNSKKKNESIFGKSDQTFQEQFTQLSDNSDVEDEDDSQSVKSDISRRSSRSNKSPKPSNSSQKKKENIFDTSSVDSLFHQNSFHDLVSKATKASMKALFKDKQKKMDWKVSDSVHVQFNQFDPSVMKSSSPYMSDLEDPDRSLSVPISSSVLYPMTPLGQSNRPLTISPVVLSTLPLVKDKLGNWKEKYNK